MRALVLFLLRCLERGGTAANANLMLTWAERTDLFIFEVVPHHYYTAEQVGELSLGLNLDWRTTKYH